MTRITDITVTKKGRYALFCESGFLFSIDEVTKFDFGIEIGTLLDDRQLARLQDASESRKAVAKGLLYLGMRPYAAGELRRKLLGSFDPDTVDYAVTYLAGIGYLDDGDFAAQYAEELLTGRRRSLREAREKMKLKGLDRETIDAALAPWQGCDEENAAYLAAGQYAGKDARKVYAALARRGFSGDAIRAAIAAAGGAPEEDFYE